MNSFFTLTILLLIGIIAADSNYKKIIHNTDPDAKCLDGSSPIIYLHEGGDTRNIIFYMIGTGACLAEDLPSTLESCYQRSKGPSGSSNSWPDVYPQANAGFLSTDPAKSRFANWTKILAVYCDGAFHQGNNKSPVQYKDSKLYFRGSVNTRSHLKYIDTKYNLSNAQRIIVSGSSAGGIATYIWLSYVKSLVPHADRVYGIADSGIFYDPLVRQQLNQNWSIQTLKKVLQDSQNKQRSLKVNDNPNPVQILMQLSNTDEKPPNKQCSNLLSQDELWKCLIIQFSYATLQFKMLFVQSSYDKFIIQQALQFKCLTKGDSGYTMKNCSNTQQFAIEEYRDFYLERFVPKLLKYGHSFWSISCIWHAQMINNLIYDSPLQQVPMKSGRTIRSAVESFVFEDKRIEYIDLYSWPSNAPCAY